MMNLYESMEKLRSISTIMDEVLDEYNAKKITKEQMEKRMNLLLDLKKPIEKRLQNDQI